MFDFDKVVLRPLQAVFGRPIWVTPRASQPGAPSYLARGDYRILNVDVQTMEGIASETTLSLAIRKSEFLVPPSPQDQVYVLPFMGQPGAGPYWVDDTDDDAQGHSVLALKEAEANAVNVPPIP